MLSCILFLHRRRIAGEVLRHLIGQTLLVVAGLPLNFENTRVALLALPEASIIGEIARFGRDERVVERVEQDIAAEDVQNERAEVIKLDFIEPGSDDRKETGIGGLPHLPRLRIVFAITDFKDYVLFSDNTHLDKTGIFRVVYRLLENGSRRFRQGVIALYHVQTLHNFSFGVVMKTLKLLLKIYLWTIVAGWMSYILIGIANGN